jgi:hypothetical protein
MKVHAALFALCVAHTAAFQGPATNAFRQETALFSDIAFAEGIRTPAASSASARALEARLAALEQGQSVGDSPSRVLLDSVRPVLVQGGSLKTWSFQSPSLERVQVALRSDGRPIDCDIELWHGPDNTPIKCRVYLEDGNLRQFSAFLETPREGPNTVAIRNIANLEFPVAAAVAASNGFDPYDKISALGTALIVQGGALRTFPFDPMVDSVQIMLTTDGRPLNARIELLQGPNNNKQVLEVYTEDGLERPFYTVLETPGSGNVVRIVNTATVEFPLMASVEPYSVSSADIGLEPVLGGDDEYRR